MTPDHLRLIELVFRMRELQRLKARMWHPSLEDALRNVKAAIDDELARYSQSLLWLEYESLV